MVAANYCGGAGLGFTVTSTEADSLGWVSMNNGPNSLLTNGGNVGETHGAPQAMTLHLVRGTGAA